MKWYEVVIKASKEVEELIIAILDNFDHQGFAIDDNTVDGSMDWDYLDESFVKRDYILIKVYFDERIDIVSVIEEFKERIGSNLNFIDQSKVEICYSLIEEDKWVNEWKKYHKPVKVGNIIISTSWNNEIKKLYNEEIIVNIDPGMAFGTGGHPTTIMCIEALQKYLKKGMDVLDVGTGSGILSIVAKKLGARRVVAVDIDETAVDIAKYNAKLNNVDIEIFKNNLVDDIKDQFNIVVANIIAEVIVKLTNKLGFILKDRGFYIVSGIIPEKVDNVIETLKDNSFEILEIKEKENWYSIVSTK